MRALLAAVAAAVFLAACGSQAPTFKGADITGASFGRELALADHHGNARTLADFRGKAVVIFFGFTQ
jgi:protein SCO1